MKHLIIIGASGFGRDIYEMALNSIGYGIEYDIKGFVVHKPEYLNSLVEYTNYPPILGTLENYEIDVDDVFICSFGDVNQRQLTYDYMKTKGAIFCTIIHKTATILSGVKIGEGCVLEPMAFVGSGAQLGNNCLVQISTIIGHDCKLGDNSRVDCMAVMTGGSSIGNCTVVHTGAILYQKVSVGDHCVVGAGSFVFRKIKDGKTVYGNPAKELDI